LCLSPCPTHPTFNPFPLSLSVTLPPHTPHLHHFLFLCLSLCPHTPHSYTIPSLFVYHLAATHRTFTSFPLPLSVTLPPNTAHLHHFLFLCLSPCPHTPHSYTIPSLSVYHLAATHRTFTPFTFSLSPCPHTPQIYTILSFSACHLAPTHPTFTPFPLSLSVTLLDTPHNYTIPSFSVCHLAPHTPHLNHSLFLCLSPCPHTPHLYTIPSLSVYHLAPTHPIFTTFPLSLSVTLHRHTANLHHSLSLFLSTCTTHRSFTTFPLSLYL
jgi:hypothetical protein